MPLKSGQKAAPTDPVITIRQTKDDLIFKIHVLPRSSRTMAAGVYDNALKLKITAPPVHGAANRMCITFLSKCLKIPKSSITIISGKNAQTKQIRINTAKFEIPENEIHRLTGLLKALAKAT